MTPAAIVVCTLFMLIGPALIMLNQYILKAMNFPYPMTLSGIGVVASGLFSYVLILTGHVKIQRAEAIEGWLWYKRVLPVGMASAATLAFGNIVSFFSHFTLKLIVGWYTNPPFDCVIGLPLPRRGLHSDA